MPWKPTKAQESIITAAIYVARRDALLSPHTWNPDTVEFVARRLAGAFQNSHPGFDAVSFLDSCGIGMGDFDAAVYTVRDNADAIVGEFRTEDEALAYGSHLANANPDELYSVVVGKWVPSPSYIERKAI